MVVVTHQAEKILVVTHQAEKFGLMTVRASVQDATFNMRGQLYRGQANATALSSRPEVSALGVVPLRSAGKKMRAPLLGWLNLYITNSF